MYRVNCCRLGQRGFSKFVLPSSRQLVVLKNPLCNYHNEKEGMSVIRSPVMMMTTTTMMGSFQCKGYSVVSRRSALSVGLLERTVRSEQSLNRKEVSRRKPVYDFPYEGNEDPDAHVNDTIFKSDGGMDDVDMWWDDGTQREFAVDIDQDYLEHGEITLQFWYMMGWFAAIAWVLRNYVLAAPYFHPYATLSEVYPDDFLHKETFVPAYISIERRKRYMEKFGINEDGSRKETNSLEGASE